MFSKKITYNIKQEFKYEENDWWRWWIWIDSKEEDLDAIEYVTYTLHPTFIDPVRKITDKISKFKLETEGWGTFTIYAKIVMKNKKEVSLKHELHLEYPDGTKNEE